MGDHFIGRPTFHGRVHHFHSFGGEVASEGFLDDPQLTAPLSMSPLGELPVQPHR